MKIKIIPRIVWGRNLLFGNKHIYYRDRSKPNEFVELGLEGLERKVLRKFHLLEVIGME